MTGMLHKDEDRKTPGALIPITTKYDPPQGFPRKCPE